jgi:hypothetical protein
MVATTHEGTKGVLDDLQAVTPLPIELQVQGAHAAGNVDNHEHGNPLTVGLRGIEPLLGTGKGQDT